MSDQAVEDLLKSSDWQRRLAEARIQREKVLAERARIGALQPDLAAPKKPWERDSPPRPAKRPAREPDAADGSVPLLPQVVRAIRPASVVVLRPVPDPAPTAAPLQRSIPKGRVTFRPVPVADAAVPPLTAAGRGTDRQGRSAVLPAVAAAFAAGLALGGGLFLWNGRSTAPASAPVEAAADAAAVAAASPGRPAASAVPAQLGPDTWAAAESRQPPDRPQVAGARAEPALLSLPQVPDAAMDMGHAPRVAAAAPSGPARPQAAVDAAAGEALPVIAGSPEPAVPGIPVLAPGEPDTSPARVTGLPRPDLSVSVGSLIRTAAAPGASAAQGPGADGPAPVRVPLPRLAAALSAQTAVAVPDAARQPAAPPVDAPPLAGAAFPDLSVRLLASPRAAASAPAALAGTLAASGFRVTDQRAVPFAVSRTHVRYYHPEDASAAEAVALTFGGIVRDMSAKGPPKAAGTVEVWIGASAGPALALDAAAPPAIRKKTQKTRLKVRQASVQPQTDQTQIRALRDRIIQQLQSGGQP